MLHPAALFRTDHFLSQGGIARRGAAYTCLFQRSAEAAAAAAEASHTRDARRDNDEWPTDPDGYITISSRRLKTFTFACINWSAARQLPRPPARPLAHVPSLARSSS